MTTTSDTNVDPLVALDELASAVVEALTDARAPVLSIGALTSWAERRLAVQQRLQALELSARTALNDTMATTEGEPLSLDELDIAFAGAVRERLDRIRALAFELEEHDARRMALMTKMRPLMRAYVTTLCPPTQAYGRNGASLSTSAQLPPGVSSMRRSA